MIGFGELAKLGHVSFATEDVDRLAEYYREVVGFTETERTGDAVYLTSGQDHHTVAVHRGGEDALVHLAFQLSSATTLDAAARALREAGVAAQRKSDAEPGIPDLLELEDPEGNTLLLYQETAGTDAGPSGRGVQPNKLGHVCVRANDVETLCSWYEGVLGLRWSDWIGDFFVFIRCNSDHHALNLLKGPQTGNVVHHVAYELRDMSHVQEACDHLHRNDFQLVWGPGRHGPGHNVFTYHRDPDGHLVEFFTQLDVVNESLGAFDPRPWHEDNPQRPKRWVGDPLAPNRWGIPPPDGFM